MNKTNEPTEKNMEMNTKTKGDILAARIEQELSGWMTGTAVSRMREALAEYHAPDPYAELKAAHAAGKVIQLGFNDGTWEDSDFGEPHHDPLPASRYRIKPDWTLGRSVNGFTLGDGQEWRWPEVWTEENLNGSRPLIEGESEQYGDEFSSLRAPFTEWQTISSGRLEQNPVHYERPRRTRRPLPKVKKPVPLGPEDVKCGDLLSDNPQEYQAMITHKGPSSVSCPDCGLNMIHRFKDLFNSAYRISRDGGKTWEACSKESI